MDGSNRHLQDPMALGANYLAPPGQPHVVSSYRVHDGRSASDETDLIITPRFILRVLWQWWYVVLPISAICAAASATGVYFTFTPQYRASAQIQIASRTPYIAYEARETVELSAEFVETQIELLTSGLVLEPVVAQPAIAEIPEIRDADDQVEWLSDRIKVTQVGRSEIYQVSYSGADPANAARIVNAVMGSYFNIRRKDDASRTERVIELLNREKLACAEKKKELQKNLKEIMASDPFALRSHEMARHQNPLELLENQLVTAEVNSLELRVRIEALQEDIQKDAGEVPIGEVEVETAISSSAEIQGLRSMLATKRMNLHMTESVAAQGKDNNTYRRLEREIRDLERQIETAVATARPQLTQQFRMIASLDRKDSLAKMKKELENQQAVVELMRGQYAQKQQEAAASDKSIEAEIFRSEIALQDKVWNMIEERSMALRTELNAPGRVTMLQSAVPPRGPVARIPLRNMALAILGSGGLPFAVVLLWELSVRRIADVEQLMRKSALSVVGEVAKLPMRARIGEVHRTKGMSLFEESIDSLRVGLWLPEERQGIKVLAVASAIHGEGKSSIASQLAVSIARSTDELILLIDADMRSPDIHNIFGIPKEPGLVQLLEGRCTPEEAIVAHWSEKVHLLPAGKLTKSPHKLLGSDVLAKLLNGLRANYRVIIIDTPPILSAAEALQLAKLADGTIVCTRRNYSREHQVELAYERLVAAGARPLGAVFNAVPTRRYAYTYGNYEYTRRFD